MARALKLFVKLEMEIESLEELQDEDGPINIIDTYIDSKPDGSWAKYILCENCTNLKIIMEIIISSRNDVIDTLTQIDNNLSLLPDLVGEKLRYNIIEKEI